MAIEASNRSESVADEALIDVEDAVRALDEQLQRLLEARLGGNGNAPASSQHEVPAAEPQSDKAVHTVTSHELAEVNVTSVASTNDALPGGENALAARCVEDLDEDLSLTEGLDKDEGFQAGMSWENGMLQLCNNQRSIPSQGLRLTHR
jgi:hypothetical protein